MNHFRKSVKHW